MSGLRGLLLLHFPFDVMIKMHSNHVFAAFAAARASGAHMLRFEAKI